MISERILVSLSHWNNHYATNRNKMLEVVLNACYKEPRSKYRAYGIQAYSSEDLIFPWWCTGDGETTWSSCIRSCGKSTIQRSAKCSNWEMTQQGITGEITQVRCTQLRRNEFKFGKLMFGTVFLDLWLKPKQFDSLNVDWTNIWRTNELSIVLKRVLS